MEAEINGYAEGHRARHERLPSLKARERTCLSYEAAFSIPAPLANSVLNGITRSSVLTIARELGFTVVEQALPP